MCIYVLPTKYFFSQCISVVNYVCMLLCSFFSILQMSVARAVSVLKPKIGTFLKYARVELVPPSPGELSQVGLI